MTPIVNRKTLNMRKLLITALSFLVTIYGFSQKNYTISGYVEDQSSGERIIGAAIYETDFHKYGTFTNEYGFYSLTMPQGTYHLHCSFVGYKPFDTIINLTRDQVLNIKLESATVLKEVVVTSYKNEIRSSQTGRIQVPVKQIQTLPVIFGEQDLLKTLQLLPGVQGGVEGSSGIYIRGGSPDQNLILLDGVPVYSLSHMGGMFSIFTPEAIKEVTLYKSGFPARFGGRLSSVIDVRMKDGNLKKYSGAVSIGLISSKATLEGPIVRDKASFIISVRRTYYDLIARPLIRHFSSQEELINNSKTYNYTKSFFSAGYYFYDIYAKTNYKINDKNRIFLSFYSGLDKISLLQREYNYLIDKIEQDTNQYKSYEKFASGWGNTIIALRWNHNLTPKHFVNTTLTYSKFFLNMGEHDTYYMYEDGQQTNSDNKFNYDLFVQDLALNINFSYQPNDNHYIRYGLQGIYHKFLPGQLSFYQKYEQDSGQAIIDTSFGYSPLYAPEAAFYIEDNIKFNQKLKANIGLRASNFIIRQKTFYSIEPRISVSYQLKDNLSIKASYAQMTQYLHLLPNNSFILPLDLWLPATDRAIPEFSWQVAGGIWWLAPQDVTISIEAYYKKMNNLIEYKEGKSWFSLFEINPNSTESWENIVTQGIGYSYGIDILLRRDFGKWHGWLGYSLAWSYRKFNEINFGRAFPFKYDTRHNIDLALTYKKSERFNMGLVWVFSSGRPITIPLGVMYNPINLYNKIHYEYTSNYEPIFKPQGVYYFSGRNNYRLPAYHRLDLSFNFNKQKRHGVRTWSLGVYNIYNHKNPVFAFIINKNFGYASQDSKPHYVLRVFSIFQIMPYITYSFHWN